MLFQQANGGGPQLAAGQERAATDRNIAQAYAMAQANPYDPGAARNAANNVAMANQDAAQQSALLQMQQQLAAQGQLSGVLGAMRGQDLTGSGQQLQGQMTGEQARIDALVKQQQINVGAYEGSAGRAAKVIGGLAGGGGSVGAQNAAGAAGTGSAGTASAGAAAGDAAMAAPVMLARGGQVPPQMHPAMYAGGGHVPSHAPSISIILPTTYAATGGMVPGQASVPGNSYANDTVQARLSPGEIVLPKSVTDDPDAAEKAKLFVQAIEKQGRKAR